MQSITYNVDTMEVIQRTLVQPANRIMTWERGIVTTIKREPGNATWEEVDRKPWLKA
jgi:hypothetical protein